jgi:hypothetical protein
VLWDGSGAAPTHPNAWAEKLEKRQAAGQGQIVLAFHRHPAAETHRIARCVLRCGLPPQLQQLRSES